MNASMLRWKVKMNIMASIYLQMNQLICNFTGTVSIYTPIKSH